MLNSADYWILDFLSYGITSLNQSSLLLWPHPGFEPLASSSQPLSVRGGGGSGILDGAIAWRYS
jgi:hypothetical protein